MSELIASGTTTSAWADFTVPQGEVRALFIKPSTGTDGPMPSGPQFEVAHKTGDNDYVTFLILDVQNNIDRGAISAPGNYGARRLATPIAAGLDIEGA